MQAGEYLPPNTLFREARGQSIPPASEKTPGDMGA